MRASLVVVTAAVAEVVAMVAALVACVPSLEMIAELARDGVSAEVG